MVLYTEAQLDQAYEIYVKELLQVKIIQGIKIPIPDREEFRTIFEETWEQQLEDDFWLGE
jgi:hypothetical protein|tara:strand:+ start:2077 stop:2256 length:180 start_codon:yes stop_codon:yes gene_type:complete